MATKTIRPTTQRVAVSSPKRHLAIHPLSREGFHQIWDRQTGVNYGRGYEGFDSHEGTYGYLYPLKSGHIVFCTEFGRPVTVFDDKGELDTWLRTKADTVEWI